MGTNRIKKIQRQLKLPLIVTNSQDLFYLTGHFFVDGGFLLITNKQVVLFGGFLENTKGLKTDFLKNIGKYVRTKSIQLDNHTSLLYQQWLKRFLSKVKFEVVESPVKELRLIKESSELEKMQEAYEITAKVFSDVKKVLKKRSFTEVELAKFIRLSGISYGADDESFPTIVASGVNAAVPHHVPTTKKIKQGESIVLDFGFKIQGYCSDFTRTVFIKRIPAKLADMYLAAEEAYKRAFDSVKNNIDAKVVDLAARDFLDSTGYGKYFIHSLGHGTGLDVHENPRVHDSSPDKLLNNMVFSIEPGIYIPKVGGIRIEDLVYVKNNKANYFQKVSTKLEDMVIR